MILHNTNKRSRHLITHRHILRSDSTLLCSSLFLYSVSERTPVRQNASWLTDTPMPAQEWQLAVNLSCPPSACVSRGVNECDKGMPAPQTARHNQSFSAPVFQGKQGPSVPSNRVASHVYQPMDTLRPDTVISDDTQDKSKGVMGGY